MAAPLASSADYVEFLRTIHSDIEMEARELFLGLTIDQQAAHICAMKQPELATSYAALSAEAQALVLELLPRLPQQHTVAQPVSEPARGFLHLVPQIAVATSMLLG